MYGKAAATTTAFAPSSRRDLLVLFGIVSLSPTTCVYQLSAARGCRGGYGSRNVQHGEKVSRATVWRYNYGSNADRPSESAWHRGTEIGAGKQQGALVSRPLLGIDAGCGRASMARFSPRGAAPEGWRRWRERERAQGSRRQAPQMMAAPAAHYCRTARGGARTTIGVRCRC
jgi:hypothetical protein